MKLTVRKKGGGGSPLVGESIAGGARTRAGGVGVGGGWGSVRLTLRKKGVVGSLLVRKSIAWVTHQKEWVIVSGRWLGRPTHPFWETPWPTPISSGTAPPSRSQET